MNKDLNTIMDIKKNKMMDAYHKHHMELMFMDSVEELHEYLNSVLVNQKTVSVGGSQTLFETGVIDLLKNSDVKFDNRYEEGLTPDEVQDVFRRTFFNDLFITSTNAMTTDGYLYNIDYTGNRVAAMIYGPKEVIVIAGKNKIFESEASAIEHVRNVACPANCVRLNRNTPCTKTGKCMDCVADGRLCSSYVKMGYQREVNRIKVIILNEDYGY